jgi:rhamnulokinase
MSTEQHAATVLADKRALIAVDLGAESCRVSLLRWMEGKPVASLVHRFANAPREADGLRWDLKMIEAGLDEGLRQCAAIATEGVRALAVDGWGVDYVRVNADGVPLADPFCYRDERTIEAERSLHEKISAERMREITGIQILRINTLYQLYADTLQNQDPGEQWLTLPEYILSRWGGEQVSEYTLTTHTQLVELGTRKWSAEIFAAANLDVSRAPKMVSPGTIVGRLQGELAKLPALSDVTLIAPGCHDTASAIAGIPATGDDWAYISSGTWSLVGALIDQPLNTAAAHADNFTNLGAVGGQYCFLKNVNGMWLIQQCLQQWTSEGADWNVQTLVAAAELVPPPKNLINVDEPDLLLAGHMPQRINAQLTSKGFDPIAETPDQAPVFASLIFHSLAARYAEVLNRVAHHSGKKLKRLFIVGGGSRNEFLNRLVQQATGLMVLRGSPESSTIGNFAVQVAVLEALPAPPSCESIAHWAGQLNAVL